MNKETKEQLIRFCIEQIRSIKDMIHPTSIEGAKAVRIYVETIEFILECDN